MYHWDGKVSSKWRKLDGCSIMLPGDTLFEAEMLQELRGEVGLINLLKFVFM